MPSAITTHPILSLHSDSLVNRAQKFLKFIFFDANAMFSIRKSQLVNIVDVFLIGSNALLLQAITLGGKVSVSPCMTREMPSIFTEQVGRKQIGRIALLT